jgi:hypothetical protein
MAPCERHAIETISDTVPGDAVPEMTVDIGFQALY